MDKIILLGHTGYIGNAIYKKLQNKKIIGFSSKDINLTNYRECLKLKKHLNEKTILIICSAIKSDLGNSFETYIKNVRMAENLNKIIAKNSLKKIILLSSNSVYGVFKKHKKIDEKTPVYPDTFYSLAKIVSEKLFQLSVSEKKLLILRPTTIYGPNELIVPNTPSGFLRKAIDNRGISLWGDGSEIRDFLFIEDIVEIISKIINKNIYGILNLASGEKKSYADSIKIISKVLKKKINFESKKRTLDPVDKIYNINLFYKYFPQYKFTSLEKGLHKIIKNLY